MGSQRAAFSFHFTLKKCMNYMAIYTWLRAKRNEYDLTLLDVSLQTGIAESTLSRLETLRVEPTASQKRLLEERFEEPWSDLAAPMMSIADALKIARDFGPHVDELCDAVAGLGR